MTTNPTSGWDQVPLYGTWHVPFADTPQSGYLELTIDRKRITRVNGAVIWTGGKARVNLDGNGSVATTVPANDDPDLSPESQGFHVHVREVFNDGSGQEYDISPSLSTLTLTPPGVNLGLVYVDPSSPLVPSPVLIKGVANGVATLDSTGHVPASQLPAGTGGGTTVTAVRNSDGTYDLTIG